MLILLSILTLFFHTAPNTKSQHLAFAHDRMNTIYVGIDNPMTLAVEGFQPEEVELRVQGGGDGSLQPRGGWQYNLLATRPTAHNGPLQIELYDKTNNLLIARFPFRVRRIPTPVVSLPNGRVDGKIDTDLLRIQPGLVAESRQAWLPPDFFKVVSYDFYYYPRSGDAVHYAGAGNSFSSDIKQTLRQIQPGDRIQITRLRVDCGEPVSRSANGLAFEAK